MSNIIITLNSLFDSLPDSEKRVADFILNNPEKAPYLSIQKLAEAGETSVASVTRLSQKAGCKNVKELKIKLAGQIDSGLTAVFEGIEPEDSDSDCVGKIFGGNIRCLENTLQALELENLSRCADAAAKADRVLFIGFGSSGYIARDGALRFSHLGLPVSASENPMEILLTSSSLGPGSLLIAVSHSGRTVYTVKGAAAAKKNGATVVSISNYPTSPLGGVSDIFLCTAFAENMTRAAAVSSRISQIAVIDALHVLTARRLNKPEFIERTNTMIEDEFRG